MRAVSSMSYTRPGSVNALPKDAQFKQQRKLEFVITIGLTIPPNVLARADKVFN
jgi:hypothetical protein